MKNNGGSGYTVHIEGIDFTKNVEETESKINIGGVGLTKKQVNELVPSKFPVNEDGKVVVKYINDLDYSRIAKSLPSENFNTTGLKPFNEEYNLTYFMSKVEKWSSSQNLEFHEQKKEDGYNINDVIQVGLCPNLISGVKQPDGSSHNAGVVGLNVRFKESKKTISGGIICVSSNHSGTFAHEIGHALGIAHPDQNPSIKEAFSKYGYDLPSYTVMNSYRTKRTPMEPQSFDKALFEFAYFKDSKKILEQNSLKTISNKQVLQKPELEPNEAQFTNLKALQVVALLAIAGLFARRRLRNKNEAIDRIQNDVEMPQTSHRERPKATAQRTVLRRKNLISPENIRSSSPATGRNV